MPDPSNVASDRGPDAMRQVIAEVQELGELDPAAREELLENLKQTDPQLWPLVAQQFRANLAYRRQLDRRESSRSTRESPAALPAAHVREGQTERSDVRATATASHEAGESSRSAAHDSGAAVDAGDSPTAVVEPPAPQSSDRPPPAEPAASTPNRRGQVVAAGYSQSVSADWRNHLSRAIDQLASEVPTVPGSDREFAAHARLHMLYLLADRRDEALRPIPALDAGMQQFWSGQFYGLAALWDTEMISDPSQRKAEAKRHLSDSLDKLAGACSLVVRNLTFATAIDDFGIYKPFDQYEFQPGQPVLLYAEIENFKSEETAKGHRTALRSSYQIFNSGGQRVAEYEFPTNEEYCRNPRRDFFMSYEFCLPERIFPGPHTLQLTVVDLNSQKIGQSLIEFTVKSDGR